MKLKLTDEQKEQMSYTDVAYLVLSENGKKMTIQDLFKKVVKLLDLPESIFESKIADFFGLMSTDKRFIMLEKGFWDLKINNNNKVTIEEDEEEEEIVTEEIEEKEEENDTEVNYDDDSVEDDDEDDDLKDLVIVDEDEEQDMM